MYGALNKYPYSNYSFGVTIPCGPENVDKLIGAALEEIEKIRASGPSEADLSKVKETWRQQHQVNMKENSFWARHLLQSEELGVDPPARSHTCSVSMRLRPKMFNRWRVNISIHRSSCSSC